MALPRPFVIDTGGQLHLLQYLLGFIFIHFRRNPRFGRDVDKIYPKPLFRFNHRSPLGKFQLRESLQRLKTAFGFDQHRFKLFDIITVHGIVPHGNRITLQIFKLRTHLCATYGIADSIENLLFCYPVTAQRFLIDIDVDIVAVVGSIMRDRERTVQRFELLFDLRGNRLQLPVI